MTKGPVHVSVFGKTDLGRSRDHNEDTFLVADLSTGKATHPIQAPLGHTRTGAPLTVTAASPLPALPKMKLESRASTTSPGEGYTTLSASGPRTSGTGGRCDADAGASAPPAAGETGGGGDGEHAGARASGPRRASRPSLIRARYTLIRTYAKRRGLTAFRRNPRFSAHPLPAFSGGYSQRADGSMRPA